MDLTSFSLLDNQCEAQNTKFCVIQHERSPSEFWPISEGVEMQKPILPAPSDFVIIYMHDKAQGKHATRPLLS